MLKAFILRERRNADAMSAFMALNWRQFADAGRPLKVVVSVYRRDRTGEQNALMWVWLDQIARDAWAAGRQFSAEVWHEHMKREHLPDMCSKGTEKWRVLPSGERVLAMSTTDLNVAEMGDYMTRIQAYAGQELGIELFVMAREVDR